MADLLALRNAYLRSLPIQAARKGAVSTYNPQQQLRELQERQRTQQERQQLAQRAATGDSYDQKVAAYKAQQAQQNQGGGNPFKQILGTVLGSDIGKAAMTGLRVIDVPRRATVMAAENAINNMTGRTNDIDGFDDVKDRLWDDQEYGFGSVVGDVTPNKWLNRAIGFAGDLALDPTTYVTLGGANVAGAAGREAAAVAARRGAQELGEEISEDMLQRITRYGVGVLSPEERATFNRLSVAGGGRDVGESGLRWMGQRLPGTGGVDRGVSTALARTRAGLMDTRAGQALHNLRVTPEVAQARNVLQGGRTAQRAGGGLSVDGALDLVADNAQRRGGNQFGEMWARQSQVELRDAPDDLLHAVERGEGGTDLFVRMQQALTQEGLDVPVNPNYVPHIPTRKAAEFWRDVDDDVVNIFVDDLSPSGALRQRQLTTGTYKIKGKTITLNEGTLAEKQRVLSEAFPEVGDFYLTKPVEVAQTYARMVGEDVGRARGLREIGQPLNQTQRHVEDWDAMRANRRGAIEGANAAKRSAQEGARDSLGEAITALEGAGRTLRSEVANRRDAAARGGVTASQSADAARAASVSAERGATQAARSAGAHPNVGDVARADVDRLQAELDRVDQVLDLLSGTDVASQPYGGGAGINRIKEYRREVQGDLQRAQEFLQTRKKVVDAADMADLDAQLAEAQLRDAQEMLQIAEQAEKDLRRAFRTANRKTAGLSAPDAWKLTQDLDAVVRALGSDESLRPVADLLTAATEALVKVDAGRDAAARWQAFAEQMVKSKPEDLARITKLEVRNGWTQVADSYMIDDVAIRSEVERAFKRVEKMVDDKATWRLFNAYTSFFKTYATLSPGFHVRNWMGATFMNFTEGVSVRTHQRAFKLFRDLQKDPVATYEAADQATRTAIDAAYGSGMGGGVSNVELFGSRKAGKLLDNRVTQGSRRVGEYVEGPARLALALDSTAQGMGFDETLARITRVHFDYSQVSQFDRRMKQLIPFWTFMSRNLPLQLQQIVSKPRAYQAYANFVRNFSGDDDELMPLWWKERGAFNIGGDFFAMPDLQHVNVAEDAAKFDPRDPTRMISNLNPALRVPLETLVADKKFFTNAPFRDDENKWLYALLNTVPFVAQGARLSGTGQYDGQAIQNLVNYLGVPVRQLTPELRERERRRQKWERESD